MVKPLVWCRERAAHDGRPVKGVNVGGSLVAPHAGEELCRAHAALWQAGGSDLRSEQDDFGLRWFGWGNRRDPFEFAGDDELAHAPIGGPEPDAAGGASSRAGRGERNRLVLKKLLRKRHVVTANIPQLADHVGTAKQLTGRFMEILIDNWQR